MILQLISPLHQQERLIFEKNNAFPPVIQYLFQLGIFANNPEFGVVTNHLDKLTTQLNLSVTGNLEMKTPLPPLTKFLLEQRRVINCGV